MVLARLPFRMAALAASTCIETFIKTRMRLILSESGLKYEYGFAIWLFPFRSGAARPGSLRSRRYCCLRSLRSSRGGESYPGREDAPDFKGDEPGAGRLAVASPRRAGKRIRALPVDRRLSAGPDESASRGVVHQDRDLG